MIFFVKFIYMPQKIAIRVAVNVILVIIFYNFTSKGGLYIYYKFLIIHKRANIYFNIILSIMVLIVLWFLIKLIISD